MDTIIIKGRLVDGRGDAAIENGMVVVRDDFIEYAGKWEDGLAEGGRLLDAGNGTILPGFIDCHAHLSGREKAGAGARHDDALLAAAHDIGELLDAGFTGLRDMSVAGLALSRGVERGYVRGPRILPGGRVLSCTSGHVDPAGDEMKDEVNHKGTLGGLGRLCDGEADCLLAAREQFRHGAKFIKICATGGVSSIADGLEDVQFAPNELRVFVEEAARHGTYVAAHCSNNAGTWAALQAGVTSIEHGVDLRDETIELMAKMDATLVTTLAVSLGVANIPGLHPNVAAKAKMCAEANVKTIERARKAGIRIALGTDYSNSKNSPYAMNGKEFEAMTRAGMTPMEAIVAGTLNAAHLMRMSDKIGSLEKGKLADLVVVDGNPLTDIWCLVGSAHIKAVLKGGVVEKNTLA